jgi:hypothetical protein
MAFNGRRDCRTASAETRQIALQTAIENTCALLASGVTESFQCQSTAPESVQLVR